MEILTGIRWVTFVKFPEALFAGINENTEAVVEPTRKTFPLNLTPGNASICKSYILPDVNFRNFCFFKKRYNPQIFVQCQSKD